MKVVFDHSRSEAANIATFCFRSEQTLAYTAGQFIELTLPHSNPDVRGTKHWFTLSSSPSDDLLSITTKFETDKGSTFKKALRNLSAGDGLTMSAAMGDFVLPKFIQTPLIFVAGGMGITPFRSILEWLAASGEHRPIKLIYGVGGEDEIIFQDTFDRAKQHATIVVSQPSGAWGGERGPLTADLILGLEKPADDALIYVSGPESMVEGLAKDLTRAGVSRRQLVLDHFPGYQL